MKLNKKDDPAFSLFSLMLPSERETLLLQACLLERKIAEAAWDKFQKGTNAPGEFFQQERQGLKRLLPLLYKNLQTHNLPIEEKFERVLRDARDREALRSQTFRDNFTKTLQFLNDNNFPFTLLKGTALAEMVYGDWSLRPCYDVDILIHYSHLRAIKRTLYKAEAERPPSILHAPENGLYFNHITNLPVEAHSNLFPVGFYLPPLHDLLKRRRKENIANVTVPVFSLTDTLYQIIGHAACSGSRKTLRWVCDAIMIIKKHSVDWDLFLSIVLQSKMTIPFAIYLNYLTKEFNTPIPEKVLKQITFTASCATRVEIEAAFTCLRMGRNGSVQNLLDHATEDSLRRQLLKWLFLPSLECLEWSYGIEKRWAAPFFYFYRPFKYCSSLIMKSPIFKMPLLPDGQ